MAECPTVGRKANGEFTTGNPGRPVGTPSKSAFIREQILGAFDLKVLQTLKTNDPKAYLDIIVKVLPKHVQAEIGAVGSIGEACDLALKRAGLNGKVKTELGE